MKPSSVRALVATGVAGMLAAGVYGATRPAVKHALGSFAAPVPLSSNAPPSMVATLPAEESLAGAESRELRRLHNATDAGASRAPREALFPATLPRAAAPPERREALRHPAMVQRDDSRIAEAIDYLARDSHGHAALLAAYKRSGRYRATVDRVLRAWNVPDDLGALAALESGFIPTSVQPDGSAGLWELPADVAEAYGLNVRDTYDERRAVEASTELVGRFLADLKERFGSWPLAVLAFGTGYRHTEGVLGKIRSRVFDELVDELPADDSRYVFRTFALMTVLANPERFGLDGVHLDPSLATSDLEVPAQSPLSVIARASGTSVEHLRELNPEYLGDVVPTTGTAMVVHLPTEGLARAKHLLMPLLYAPPGSLDVPSVPEESSKRNDKSRGQELPSGRVPAAGGDRFYYRVREGETLASLAQRFGVAVETIASDNALDTSTALQAGRLLTIRAEHSSPSPRK